MKAAARPALLQDDFDFEVGVDEGWLRVGLAANFELVAFGRDELV
jgi:hypothetical protein